MLSIAGTVSICQLRCGLLALQLQLACACHTLSTAAGAAALMPQQSQQVDTDEKRLVYSHLDRSVAFTALSTSLGVLLTESLGVKGVC